MAGVSRVESIQTVCQGIHMDINRAAATAADRISAAFVRSGMSKKKLSEQAGIPYATLDRRFRSGGWAMSEVLAVSAAMGVAPTEFFADITLSRAAA